MRRIFSLLSTLALLATAVFTATTLASAPAGAQDGTVITVNTTLDTADTFNWSKHTCGFETGAFFFPSNDDLCTFREAIMEAGARPNADRPITIKFDIPKSDPNYDAALDIWEVQINPASNITEQGQIVLGRRFITDDGGQVTIDGKTQTGGRSDGPKIMINTNSTNSPLGGAGLLVETSNNTIKNVGFHGGGQIILHEAGNTVENVWMGLNNAGTEVKPTFLDDFGQSDHHMARGGIIMPKSASDNNTIKNNIVVGAFERAIRVTSGGSGNVITGNWIGTNKNGVVPINGTIDCTRFFGYDKSVWYGGRGVQVTGSNNKITNNVMAGLHAAITANETPPIAMEIFGFLNEVRGNKVGVDVKGNKVGSCGQGLLFGGDQSMATKNTFYFTRNGFDPNDIGNDLDSAIITQDISGGGWVKVWDNVIDGGNFDEANYHANRFADPGVKEELRKFPPAKVTKVKGKVVSGTNGDPVMNGPSGECPGCTIYLYGDDLDDRVESFVLLGQGKANNKGEWTITMKRGLKKGEALRTQSMANSSGIFPYAANTTTKLSDDLYAAPTCFGEQATVVIGAKAPYKTKITKGDDVIVGTNKGEKINGKAGNDLICGKGGKDTLIGGSGKDKCDGGGGKDKASKCETKKKI